MKLYTCTNALLVLFLLLTGCQQNPSITGVISEAPAGSMVYLIEPANIKDVASSHLGVLVDSAVIEKDGSFQLHAQIIEEEPKLFTLSIRKEGFGPLYFETDNPLKSNYMPVILTGSGDLEITANWKSFLESFSSGVPGSENQALLELKNLQLKAFREHFLNKKWDIQNGSELLERAAAILSYQRVLMHFADTTDHFLAAMVALRWVSPSGDYERTPEFLVSQCEKWSERELNHPLVSQLCELAQRTNLPVLIGDKFPDLTFPTQAGEILSTKEKLGKELTIIDLWASWCRPCRVENRNVLLPLWEKYNKQGLQIIAFGLESDVDAWQKAILKDGADRWMHGTDLLGDDTPILQQLRIQTIPSNFILDKEGVVIAKNLHGYELTAMIESKLKE